MWLVHEKLNYHVNIKRNVARKNKWRAYYHGYMTDQNPGTGSFQISYEKNGDPFDLWHVAKGTAAAEWMSWCLTSCG